MTGRTRRRLKELEAVVTTPGDLEAEIERAECSWSFKTCRNEHPEEGFSSGPSLEGSHRA